MREKVRNDKADSNNTSSTAAMSMSLTLASIKSVLLSLTWSKTT